MKVSLIMAGLAAKTSVAAPAALLMPESSPSRTITLVPYNAPHAFNSTCLGLSHPRHRHFNNGTDLESRSEDEEDEPPKKTGLLSKIKAIDDEIGRLEKEGLKKIAHKTGLYDSLENVAHQVGPAQDWRNNVPARIDSLERVKPPGVKTDWLGVNSMEKRGIVPTPQDYFDAGMNDVLEEAMSPVIPEVKEKVNEFMDALEDNPTSGKMLHGGIEGIRKTTPIKAAADKLMQSGQAGDVQSGIQGASSSEE